MTRGQAVNVEVSVEAASRLAAPDGTGVAAWLDALKRRQVPWVPRPALLGFLATTSRAGSIAATGVVELVGIGPGPQPNETDVRVRGRLPRPIAPGDTVTLSMNRYEQFRGYQIKTRPARAGESAECVESGGPGLVVHGERTYTTHHGPYELNFFERVPVDDVRHTVGDRGHAIVAIGPGANVSPRLLFHHEVEGGELATFHGDGVMMKTFRNLAVNSRAVQVLLDLDSLHGYALAGTCLEVSPEHHPEAFRQVCAGWAALGFGTPSRLFRHRCDDVQPIAAR